MSELPASAVMPNRNRRRVGQTLAAFLVFGLTSACGTDTGAAESQVPAARPATVSAAPSSVPATKLASHAPVVAECEAGDRADWKQPPSNLRPGPIAKLLGVTEREVMEGTLVTAYCKKGIQKRMVMGIGAVVTVNGIPASEKLLGMCLEYMGDASELSGKGDHVYHVAGICPAADDGAG